MITPMAATRPGSAVHGATAFVTMVGGQAERIQPTHSYHVFVDGQERAIRYQHVTALEVAARLIEAGHADVDLRIRPIFRVSAEQRQ